MQTSELKIFSGSVLKMIAIVSMTLDHVGYIIADPRISLPLRIAGRLAFPLYAFLLSEGYSHTGNLRRYALSLLALAIISEVPYDLLFHGEAFHPGQQNIMFTLLLGLGAIRIWNISGQRWLWKTLGCSSAIFLGWVLNVDYGCYGIALPLIFHFLRDRKPWDAAAGAVLSAATKNIHQAAAAIPIMLYNGQRGFIKGGLKWAFYAYYPVHICIILLLKSIL